MAKAPSMTYVCSDCGNAVTKWVGKCPACEAWNTMAERAPAPSVAGFATSGRATHVTAPARRISDIKAGAYTRISTGIGEFDRVLGGGMVPGGVVLISGSPGIGKSTLLLKAANNVAEGGLTVLIVSGEESVEQIKMRADRTGDLSEDMFLAAENDLGATLAHIDDVKPDMVIIDSIQTIASADLPGRLGSMSQITEVSNVLIRVAKERGISMFFCGHVTKDESVAGPKIVQHMVDSYCTMLGDKTTPMRLLRAEKNRFGACEVGCFTMEGSGIVEVTDPSSLFLGEHTDPTPGACVTIIVEGRRALPLEVQALTISTGAPNPRRSSSGLDNSRLAMLIAVAEKHGRVKLSNQDVFASTIGGIKVVDPAVDLALVLALASAAREMPMRSKSVALGEVALSGDVRPVMEIELRLKEAKRRGFEIALVPVGTSARYPETGLTLVEVGNVGRALQAFAQMNPKDAD